MTAPASLVATKIRASAALVLVMLIWGSTPVVTKSALTEMPPLLLAFLRFWIASALLVPLVQSRGGLALLPRPLPFGTLVVMGLTGVTLFFITFNLSLSYTSASQGSLIQGSLPAVTTALATLTLGERMERKRVMGIGVSTVGVALIVLTGGSDDAPNPRLGNLLMLGAVLSWAVYTILGKRLRQVSGLAVTTYSSFLGALFLLPAGAYDLVLHPLVDISLGTWLAVLYLGAGASALAYVLWNSALQVLEAGQAAIFTNLIPLVGVVSAAIFLGETLNLQQLLGGALVLVSVWFVVR